MPKISITGDITVSRDLFSRLLSRGLLDEQGEVSTDFWLYLHECLSRDCAGYQSAISGAVLTSIPNTPEEPVKISEPQSQEPKETRKPKIDMKTLCSSMNTLYGGSK